MSAISELSKKTVSYFSDEDISIHCLCGPNPMRPLRVKLTNKLVEGYGLDRKMKMHRPRQLSYEELNNFHADEYVDFLSKVTPRNIAEYKTQMDRFNLGAPGEADCPVFEGVFKYCQMYSGGSRDAALNLMAGDSQLAFNWSGGMHHAKRAEASGFCYVNDIVLAILELLKQHHRVLYVDIDIHHGDGVEEAFYLTDRVMTVSFHKYGDFFPGTGALEDVGHNQGIHYSVNVPLSEGMDDDSYQLVFEPIMGKVMAMFQPGAVVVCAGADSLSGDRLGCFNLSLQGHSRCLEFLAKYDVPLLVLGGGGYTMRNVSRCWAFETARLQGIDPADDLPEGFLQQHNYYMDTKRLRIDTSNMMNLNTRADLLEIRDTVLKHLSSLQPPSGAAIAAQPAAGELPDAPEGDPDARGGGAAVEELRQVKEGYESDEDGPDNRPVVRPDPPAPASAAASPAAPPDAERVNGAAAGGVPAVVGARGEGAAAAVGDAAGATHGTAPPMAAQATGSADENGAAAMEVDQPASGGAPVAESGAPVADAGELLAEAPRVPQEPGAQIAAPHSGAPPA